MDKITKLKKIVDKQQAQRLTEEKRLALTENETLIKEAPKFCLKAFYCQHCKTDFVTQAYKQVFNWGEETLAKWIPIKAKHKGCSYPVYRHITDVLADPYYRYSKLVQKQQKQYAKDLLQPGQYGFKTLYGDPEDAKNIDLDRKARLAHKNTPWDEKKIIV